MIKINFLCASEQNITYLTLRPFINTFLRLIVSRVCDVRLEQITTHSTHFILRLYGVGHMVTDHSDSERVNPLPPHGLLFPINIKGYFICIIP